MENLAQYWLAFASIEQLGSVFIKRVYENFGSPKAAWCAAPDELYRVENLTKKQIDYFIKARKVVEPEERLDFILKKGIKFINYTDAEYPQLLKQIPNPPMTLFYKGDLSRCNFNRTLSVVGSRKASENAKTNLAKILSGLANTDVCIVSGLAAGIDTCAHKAAIQNNLSTIGVIGSGFDFVYPASNRELYRQIEEKWGVIFSEYWPTEQPISWHFPHRNRIVSGLSRGTLVAEAALKSGAIITANLCLEQNRELMCMPGQISNPNTEGIYKLLGPNQKVPEINTSIENLVSKYPSKHSWLVYLGLFDLSNLELTKQERRIIEWVERLKTEKANNNTPFESLLIHRLRLQSVYDIT